MKVGRAYSLSTSCSKTLDAIEIYTQFPSWWSVSFAVAVRCSCLSCAPTSLCQYLPPLNKNELWLLGCRRRGKQIDLTCSKYLWHVAWSLCSDMFKMFAISHRVSLTWHVQAGSCSHVTSDPFLSDTLKVVVTFHISLLSCTWQRPEYNRTCIALDLTAGTWQPANRTQNNSLWPKPNNRCVTENRTLKSLP